MAEGKLAELATLPLIRARFCELLGPCAGLAESANAILDMRMPDGLREIAIREQIRDALLAKVNALPDIFELVLHYERGYWEEIGSPAARLGMSEDAVRAQWSRIEARLVQA
jgi:c-di-GMP-related signal transduction protein